MKKVIKRIQYIPGFTHPAIGGLYQVEFTDGTQDKIYAETFYHQTPWQGTNDQDLIGQEIDTEDAYWNYSEPQNVF